MVSDPGQEHMNFHDSSGGGPKWLIGALAVSCMLVSSAAEVRAQTDGAKPVGTEPGGTPPVGPEPVGNGQVDVKPWSLRFGVNEAFEDNVQLTNGGSGDLGSRVDVGVSRAIALHGGAIRFNADAGQLAYRELTSLNQFTYGIGANSTYLVTRRLTWQIGDTLTSNYAQDTRVLTDAGLIFPKVLTRTNSASTQLAYELSNRTQIRVSLSAQAVSFATSSLMDASTVTARISMTRQLTQFQSVGFSLDQARSSDITGNIQGLLGTWRATIGKGLTMNAAGGMQLYTLQGQSDYQFAPAVSVGIGVRVARNVTGSASYEHTVEQAYGFSGTHQADRLTGSSTIAIGRRVTLAGNASYGLTTNPLDPNFRLAGKAASASLGYRVVDNLTVSGVYSVWFSQDSAAQPIVAQRGGVSLSYGFSWH